MGLAWPILGNQDWPLLPQPPGSDRVQAGSGVGSLGAALA